MQNAFLSRMPYDSSRFRRIKIVVASISTAPACLLSMQIRADVGHAMDGSGITYE